jgi:thiamine transporter
MSTPVTSPRPRAFAGGARLNLNPATWDVRTLAEIGLAIALAAVLGLLKPFTMPQGGSVSLEMLPLIFLAVRRGVAPALAAGALYGAVQLTGVVGAPFIYHPLQVALDYPLAFAAVAAAGFVVVRGFGSLALAVVVGTGARFVCHFLSGLIFFASYAPHWEAPWLYSITYNLIYLVPEAVISVVALWPLLRAYDAAFPSRGLGGARF